MSFSTQTLATVLAVGVAGVAYAYDFSAIQNAVMNDPAVQQQVGAQVMKNPQLLTGAATTGAGSMGSAASMMAALTPEQKQLIMAKANAIAAKLFTPAEQASVKAYTATPTGASVMGKLPLLAQQLAPVILQMYAGGGAK